MTVLLGSDSRLWCSVYIVIRTKSSQEQGTKTVCCQNLCDADVTSTLSYNIFYKFTRSNLIEVLDREKGRRERDVSGKNENAVVWLCTAESIFVLWMFT